jgi:hypothetical protein
MGRTVGGAAREAWPVPIVVVGILLALPSISGCEIVLGLGSLTERAADGGAGDATMTDASDSGTRRDGATKAGSGSGSGSRADATARDGSGPGRPDSGGRTDSGSDSAVDAPKHGDAGCGDAGCPPVVVTLRPVGSAIEGLGGIAVDSTSVYWTEWYAVDGGGLSQGAVRSCPKSGCDGGTVLLTQASTELNQLTAIVVGADASTEAGPANLYVSGEIGFVLQLPTTGGTASTIATGLAGIGSLAYNPDPAYGGYVLAGGDSDMWTLFPDGGCNASDCTNWISGLVHAQGVSVDSQYAYVVSDPPAGNDAGSGVASTNSSDMVRRNGSAPFFILNDLPSPSGVYSDGTNVWTAIQGTAASSYVDGQIWSCPVGDVCSAGSSTPQVVAAENQQQPSAIISDGTMVYWVNAGGGAAGSIAACPISANGGCTTSPTAPLILASDIRMPTQMFGPLPLAQDANFIYWLDKGATTGSPAMRVMKVAKPTTP